MKTFVAKKKDLKRKWFIVNAEGKVLGRLATQVATVLRGKHKAIFTPNIDTGDGVIIINAKKIKLAEKKLKNKMYRNYSGYPGGLKEKNLGTLMEEKPTEAVKLAIKRMLPKGPLGRDMFKKLKVYADEKHSHDAQKPEELKIK